MTVSYQYDVASSSTGGFFRLLWRWRGSIWKLLYKELVLFIAVYLSIALSYDFLMTDYYKRYYERIVIFCSAFVEIIPLSFILGFYVSFTATRWWQQYTAIPWPDKLMNIIALYVPGNDVTSRVLRRTLMRYLNLTLVLVLRSISIPVKRRFPTKEHLVEAGFMSRPELDMYSSVPSHEFNTFWIPCTWFVNLLREAKSECRITDSGGIKLIMEEFNEFRSKCGLLWSYDWVVTLSTQAFFLASLLGRQHINPPKDQEIKSHVYGEYYIPIFTLLQFILYMGMLKLGEQLINPFGDDDEDFELNWIIDRHLKVSFLGVDILNSDPPPLMKDNYFDERDIKLPYTEAAVAHKVKTYRGSVAAFQVPTDKHGLVIPEFEDENDEDKENDDASSTVQSNRDANVRTSSWNLFGHKRKLSSSIDSFNSETMVETGLGETEDIPKLTPNLSWPNFLISEAQTQVNPGSKLHIWPSDFQNEQTTPTPTGDDSQGIRWPKEGEPTVGKGNDGLASIAPHQAGTAGISGGESNPDRGVRCPDHLAKQSSFSTSESSIVIPLGEDSDRRSSSNSYSRYFAFDKSTLQVFSKEGANVPMSVFRDLDESYKSCGDRHSFSSLPFKIRDRLIKPPKSMMKNSRAADPKLRIRPFRSKVTFSQDTKAGDSPLMLPDMSREPQPKRSFFSKFDSNSDTNVHKAQAKDNLLSVKHALGIHQSKSSSMLGGSTQKLSPQDIPFADISKRRQSLDPTMYAKIAKPEEPQKDNWLHYQSLPNIQEEDQQQTTTNSSPTETIAPISVPEIAPPISPTPPPRATPPTTNPEPGTSTSPTPTSQIITQNALLPPQPYFATADQNNSWSRRRSIKRQKSQDLPDESDLKQKIPPPIPKISQGSRLLLRKQSSDDSQNSNSSNSNQLSNKCMPPSILRRRKDELKSQQAASTESDTGSYHTVNSFRMHLEKSNSSSADSFTSANSESNNNNNPNNNGNSQSKPVPNSNGNLTSSTSQVDQLNGQNKLVPKIIFSQSTPSVTSQSSDDQNCSPKWNQQTFIANETAGIITNEIPYLLSQIQTGFDPIQGTTSLPSLQPNQSCHLTIQDPLIPLASGSSGKVKTNNKNQNDDIQLEDIAVISDNNNNGGGGGGDNSNKRSSSSSSEVSLDRNRRLNS